MSPPVTDSGAPGGHDGEEVFVLAVDLGTGGPKVALVSPKGRIAASASEPVELRLLPGGGAEQDPSAWWGAVVAASRRVLDLSSVPPSSVVGVGCTAQWSGTVAVDGDGVPLRPAVIWMDSRGSAAMQRQMRGQVSVLGYDVRKLQRWIRLTGGAPGRSGKDPTAHILWIRDVEPDVYRRHVQVPRTGGLAQPPAHGQLLSFLRLDRRPLGNRQQAHHLDRLRRLLAPHVGARALQAARHRPLRHDHGDAAGQGGRGARPSCRASRRDRNRRRALRGGGVRGGRGLRGPHLHRDVVVDLVSPSVQEDRRPAQRRLHPRRHPRSLPRRRRARDGGSVPDIPRRERAVRRRGPWSRCRGRQRLPLLRRGRGQGASGVARGHVHAMAQRGALTGRRPHHPGRVPQPLSLQFPPGPGARRVRGGGTQQPVAARCRGTVRGPALRVLGVHRRWRQLRGLVPDPRRRHGPPDPAGRRSGPRQRAGSGAPHAGWRSAAFPSRTSPPWSRWAGPSSPIPPPPRCTRRSPSSS